MGLSTPAAATAGTLAAGWTLLGPAAAAAAVAEAAVSAVTPGAGEPAAIGVRNSQT